MVPHSVFFIFECINNKNALNCFMTCETLVLALYCIVFELFRIVLYWYCFVLYLNCFALYCIALNCMIVLDYFKHPIPQLPTIV